MLSISEIETIQHDRDYWEEFEHDNWKLLAFDCRATAKFGWVVGAGEITNYVSLTSNQLKFMRGVQPDAFDYYAGSWADRSS